MTLTEGVAVAPARILYVITELDPGGAENALLNLVKRLDRRRFAPEVACLTGHGRVGHGIEQQGVPVHYLELRSSRLPFALPRLCALMKTGRFDMVHTFLFHANVLGRVAARLTRAAAVVSSVRVEEPRRWHQVMNTFTWRLADRIVAVSESTARFFCEHAHASPERVLAIANGVDASRFIPSPRRRARRQHPARVVSVGRLDIQKGCDILIEAARLCLRRSAEFVIAGDGPQRDSLERQIAELGLGHAVRLIGRTDDVPGLLGSADVFVSASRWEGMPNAVLEAMACGLPVVATSVGGCRELVLHEQTGLLVPPHDPQALAHALSQALADPDTRERYGRQARARVMERFTWERNADQHASLYEELLRR